MTFMPTDSSQMPVGTTGYHLHLSLLMFKPMVRDSLLRVAAVGALCGTWTHHTRNRLVRADRVRRNGEGRQHVSGDQTHPLKQHIAVVVTFNLKHAAKITVCSFYHFKSHFLTVVTGHARHEGQSYLLGL